MMQITIGENKGSAELLIDYQDGVTFTVLLADESQLDFAIEPHEWDVLKVFLDEQKAAEDKHTAVTNENK